MNDLYQPTEYKLPFGSNTFSLTSDEEIEFPIEEVLLATIKLEQIPDEKLISCLKRDNIYKRLTDEDDHYEFEQSKARIHSLALHFAINERSLIAPYFREDQRKPINSYKGKLKKRVDVIYSLDRQLIDIHWWCCRAKKIDLQNVSLGDMAIMTNGLINPDGLIQAVNTNWTSEKKAEALLIHEQEQLLMRSIRSKRVRDIHSKAFTSANKAITQLRAYCAQSSQRKITDADKLYQDLLALRFSEQDNKLAVQIKMLMNGDKIPQKKLASAQTKMGRSRKLFRDKLGLLKTVK
jgi:hypothetical protein